MRIRNYRPEDLKELAELFYHTVHEVNIEDYSLEEVNAWASGQIDLESWNQSLKEHYSIVAANEGIITGFGDFDPLNNYIDRLYVHKDYQRLGIGAAICNELEKQSDGRPVTVHASITARPFFEKRGYRLIKKQQAKRNGIFLTNFLMEKNISGTGSNI